MEEKLSYKIYKDNELICVANTKDMADDIIKGLQVLSWYKDCKFDINTIQGR